MGTRFPPSSPEGFTPKKTLALSQQAICGAVGKKPTRHPRAFYFNKIIAYE
jgi:hypothetical protein